MNAGRSGRLFLEQLENRALLTVIGPPASDSYDVNEDSSLGISAPGVLANDPGEPLTAELDSNASHGWVSMYSDGSFNYTPAADFWGTDSFIYQANDGVNPPATATVTINVLPINDSPVAWGESFTLNEDVPFSLSQPALLSNDTDVDGDTLTFVV